MTSEQVYVYISYPRTADIKFNSEYYKDKHMALVDKYWRPFGMKSWSVIEFPEGDPSGIHTQAIMHWESEEAFQTAWDKQFPELMNDLENYSNTLPVRWIGKVLKQG